MSEEYSEELYATHCKELVDVLILASGVQRGTCSGPCIEL